VRARIWLIVAVVLIGAGGVAGLVLRGRAPEWTTSSPQALGELELGLETQAKFYHEEARAHFAKACELDPTLVIAKYFLMSELASLPDLKDEEWKSLAAAISSADLAGLTLREQYLLRIRRARLAKDLAGADRLMEEFATRLPRDPFALLGVAALAVDRQQWDEAERLYRRVIEVAPNRVDSYNQIAYLAMGRGRFAESEKMFQTYRYLAPDQANPHDSLGELFLVIGRFDEAERELNEAIRLKPDFCASYENLVQIARVQGDVKKAEAIIARAERTHGCATTVIASLRCGVDATRAMVARDWNGFWQATTGGECGKHNESGMGRYYAAILSGRTAEAAKFVDEVHKAADGPRGKGAANRVVTAYLLHLDGAQLLFAGRPEEAAGKLREADARFTYRTRGEAEPKLVNRLLLVRALREGGNDEAAEQLLADVRGVNPRFVEFYGPIVGATS
jgi:Flp pilus assembly protein TadD